MAHIHPDRKAKDYRRIAAIEIILIFVVLTLGDFLHLLGMQQHTVQWTYGILLILEILFMYLLMELAQFLRPSRLVYRVMQAGIFAVLILSVSAMFAGKQAQSGLLTGMHSVLCAIECYLIGLTLLDIYSSGLTIVERLWGSVATYLLIALGWASFYEIFTLRIPDALGSNFSAGYASYCESLYYSLCAISGTETEYDNAIHILRNLSLVEGVWGVLFLVMLIGRIFTLPGEEKK